MTSHTDDDDDDDDDEGGDDVNTCAWTLLQCQKLFFQTLLQRHENNAKHKFIHSGLPCKSQPPVNEI